MEDAQLAAIQAIIAARHALFAWHPEAEEAWLLLTQALELVKQAGR